MVVDLTGTNLDGTNFTGDDLTELWNEYGGITGSESPSDLPADWSLADGYLVGPGVDLSNRTLSGSLAGADLEGANLYGTNLSGDDLTGTNLSNVPSGEMVVDLTGTNLDGTNFTGDDLTELWNEYGGITGSESPSDLPADWSLADGYLVGPGVDLSNRTLSGSLAGLDLENANFYGSSLSGDDLTGTDLTGAAMTATNLTGVTWSNTICPDGNNSDTVGFTCINDL